MLLWKEFELWQWMKYVHWQWSLGQVFTGLACFVCGILHCGLVSVDRCSLGWHTVYMAYCTVAWSQ